MPQSMFTDEERKAHVKKAHESEGTILAYEDQNKLKRGTINNWNRAFQVVDKKRGPLAEKSVKELKEIIFQQEIQIKKALLRTIKKNKETLCSLA